MQVDGLLDLAEDRALEAAAQASQALIVTASLFRAPQGTARTELEGRLMRMHRGQVWSDDLPSHPPKIPGLAGLSAQPADPTESEDLVERAETLVESISRLLGGMLPLILHGRGVWPPEDGVGSA